MVSLVLWFGAWAVFSVLVAALPAWAESVAVSSLSPGFRRGAWFLLALRAAVPVGFVPLVVPSLVPSFGPVTAAPAGAGLPWGAEASLGGAASVGAGGYEWFLVLGVVYTLGLVVVWARDLVARRAWNRACQRGGPPSAQVQALVDAEVTRLNLGRGPRVMVVPGLPSPCVTGPFRPSLVLPEGRFTDAELVWMVRHELEHFRAGDLWFTAAVQSLVLFLWFLPGMWWIAGRFRSATEEACDARVLAPCTRDQRLSYALTLVRLLEPGRPPQTLTAMASSVGRLKQRFRLIRQPHRASAPALVLLAAMVVVSGAWGVGESPAGAVTLAPGWPFAPGTPCWVTSGYGEIENPITKKPYFHQGIDLAARTNTPVLAIWPGTVTQTGFDTDQGFFLKVDLGGGWSVLASHLATAPSVKSGQRVEPGQVLGRVGSTGLSTGPHLHWEVLKEGVPVDPAPYLNSTKDGPAER